jgi:hypothetical protein
LWVIPLSIILTVGVIFALASFSVRAQTNTGNLTATILPSAARTAATVNSTDFTNNTWRGAHVIINVSAFTSGTYTPRIQAKDPISGNYYDLLIGPAIAATGTTVLKIYPGIVASPNAAASDILPRTWRVQVNGAATPSMTFSVSAFLEN